MKKVVLMLLLVSGTAYINETKAQINVNIGLQPAWGPVGYDYVEYYYLPDVGAYYYVPRRQFIYLNNGNWIYANSLPYRYRTYNLYSGYKVVINEPRPYLRYSKHKVQYAKYKGYNGRQAVIKNGKGPKQVHYSGKKGAPVKSNSKGKGRNKHL